MQLATDEDFTLQFADQILHGNYTRTFIDPTPPAHYFLIAGLKWMNNSVLFLRIVTVLISILTLVIFYFFAKNFFNQKLSLLATLFLAFNPAFFIYSRHLRNYALLTLLFVISLHLFYNFYFRKHDPSLSKLAGTYLAMIYTNLFSFLLILSHLFFLGVAFIKKQFTFKKIYLWQLVYAVPALLIFYPLFVFKLNYAFVQTGTIKLFPLQIEQIPYPLYKLAVMVDVSTALSQFPWIPIFALLISLLALLGIYSFFKKDYFLGLFVFSSFLGPPLFLLLFNPLIELISADHYSLYYFRYFMYLSPLFVLTLVQGISLIKSPLLKRITIAFIAIGWIFIIAYYYSIIRTVDWSRLIAV